MPQPWWEHVPEKAILFFAGLALIFNEALIRQGNERPTLIVLYGAMVGLPFVLWAKGGGGQGPPPQEGDDDE